MANRSKSVGQNETETVGGSRSFKVGGEFTMAVGENRKLTAPIMIDLSLGTISATARDSAQLVGGAVVKLSAAGISESTGKISAQLVGGARIDIAKKQRQISVVKGFRETVGFAIFMKTNGQYIDNADTTGKWTVGGQLKGEAPEILIEAQESIKLKVGGSVLTIDKDSIRLSATNLDLSAAHLDADTQTIEHN
jgi:type VI secretion system secreted protein VgrG